MGSSQRSIRQVAEEIRTETRRYIDMRVQWVLQDARGEITADSEVIIDVGGRWDMMRQEWAGPGDSAIKIGIHPGQAEAARFLKRWAEAHARGEHLTVNSLEIFSLLFEGGRRGGKTDLAAKFGATLFPILEPGTFTWMVSETEAKTEELEIDIMKWLPEDWYDHLGVPENKFTLRTGSTIWLRSAHKSSALKTGRCDLGILNEAQLINEKSFGVVRAATMDSGGLTVLAANPPDGPIGYWIERYREEAIAGKRNAQVFHFDTKRNPHVDHKAFEALRADLDERTFRREILGEFLPREDVVFYTWSDGKDGNVRPVPDEKLCPNITTKFLRRFFGRDFDAVIGMDFQRVPYPCAVEMQAFPDPDDPKGEPLLWLVDETVAELGDEAALSDLLLEKGYDPKRTVIIADSSGAWQGIDREERVPSFEIFKALGWPHVYRSDPNMKKNPNVIERVKLGNSLFKNADGKRRVFSAPELMLTNRSLKLWENRNGTPYRKSEYAHLADAVTYPLWHFYPRTRPKKGGAIAPPTIIPISIPSSGPRIL